MLGRDMNPDFAAPHFALAERLAADTVPVADLALCRVLLMDNRLYPWLVLVPMRPDLRELHDLGPADRALLVEEAARASALLAAEFAVDKVNVGMLGNLVPQLHCHVVGRRQGDAAWPGPVWGGPAERYEAGERDRLAARLRGFFAGSAPNGAGA
jgi:diadenosine tetraphosphate (Ap4A) HIT family hydrolase